jgi:serine/threonine-protein kinase
VNVTRERWQDIARIYELAVDHDAATRSAFLSEACEGDEALRREVEALFRQDAASVVLDRPVWATAGSLFDDSPKLCRGAALGPYRIEAPLGAGGMGEVFRAVDTRLDRLVAIKVLPTRIALDQQMRARFAREAKAVAALTHPHICTLYDIGRHDEIDFIVMEYLEGDTLAARLTKGRLSLDQAIVHAIEIASALDHAHRHGIVHRDLKPANVLLTASGAKLLDFGLATFRPAARAGIQEVEETGAVTISVAGAGVHASEQREGDDAQVTRGGTILGTIRYMAPEQLEGHEADARSDLFSFGAVVYEMVTGRRAFDGESTADIRNAILEHEPPLVSSLQPRAPSALDDIVRRCLLKDPHERWQSADDALRALKRISESGGQARTWTRAMRWTAAILIAAVTGVAGWLVAERLQHRPESSATSRIRSIAVLPLENLSGDPEQEYFADGMTEQLTADLAKVDELRVISRESVMRYRAMRKPLPTIVRELNVDSVIEGSVLRVGDTVRITVKLVSGATRAIIWAQSYERGLGDVLALQSEVARTITREVGITLSPQEQAHLANERQVDPEVHRHVLLGRHHTAKGTEEGLRTAIHYFDMAIAKDPASAFAHAGRAEAYAELSGFYADPRDVMPVAKRAAEAALRLDDSLAQAHAVLGYVQLVYEWNGPAAAQELQRALALNPTLATARLNYASYLSTQGRHDEAVREIRQAVDLDPMSIRTSSVGTVVLLFSRRYDEAIELARKGLEFEPTSAFTLAFQGVAYAEQGRFQEAVDNLQRAAALDDSLTILALEAHVLAAAGRKQQATRILRQVEGAAKHRYFCPYEIATVYVSLGDPDTAFRLFRKGTNEHADCMAWLGVEPWLDPFRSDPRYGSLLRDIGLAPTLQ